MLPTAPPLYSAKRIAPKPPIKDRIEINLTNIINQLNSAKLSLTLLEKKLKELKEIIDEMKHIVEILKNNKN